MKQYDREAYLSLLRLWDKKHHLVGRTQPERLYKESVQSLKSISKENINRSLIDLGAGNGILGIPALLEGFALQVCLIEPLPKRAAFLEAVKAEMRARGDERYKGLSVVPLPVQNVSRETLLRLLGDNFDKIPVLSRAFSGALSMKDALSASPLKGNPCYKFFVLDEAKAPQYVLVREEL